LVLTVGGRQKHITSAASALFDLLLFDVYNIEWYWGLVPPAKIEKLAPFIGQIWPDLHRIQAGNLNVAGAVLRQKNVGLV
jgi:hypothetical protein